jgi:hypothetical protein
MTTPAKVLRHNYPELAVHAEARHVIWLDGPTFDTVVYHLVNAGMRISKLRNGVLVCSFGEDGEEVRLRRKIRSATVAAVVVPQLLNGTQVNLDDWPDDPFFRGVHQLQATDLPGRGLSVEDPVAEVAVQIVLDQMGATPDRTAIETAWTVVSTTLRFGVDALRTAAAALCAP